MAIPFECTGCGKKLKVKDEAAGKRIKCPECQAVLMVPVPESSGGEDDFLGGLDEAVKQEKKRPRVSREDEEEEDYDDEPPVSSPKRRSKKTATKKKSSSSGASGGVLKAIGGGLIGLLVVLGIIGKVAKVARLGGAFNQKVTWQRFHSPQGGASIDMPGVPTVDAQQTKDANSPVYSIKTSRFMCSFASVALPPGAGAVAGNAAATQMIFNEMKRGYTTSHPTARLISETPIQLGTAQGLQLRFEASGAVNVSRFYLTNSHIVVAEFVSTSQNESATDRDHYLGSIQIAGNPVAGAAMPGMNMPNSMPPGMNTPTPQAGHADSSSSSSNPP